MRVFLTYLCRKAKVGSERPPAAAAVAERGAGVVGRVEGQAVAQPPADAASFVRRHVVSF